MKTVMTIAGTDPSGGAGIQADIKTITVHNKYATSAITALVAQNTCGVTDIYEIEPAFIGKQLDSIITDIRPDAVKIGMVSNPDIITLISDKLAEYKLTNIVVDPVMVATSGDMLISENAKERLQELLFPQATVVTPNAQEAAVLTGLPVTTHEEMKAAANHIAAKYPNLGVLVKGGHVGETSIDMLLWQGVLHEFEAPRINTNNTHGTGCTLSSAIACNLAEGMSLITAVELAKAYVHRALSADLQLGKGNGPLNHMVAPS